MDELLHVKSLKLKKSLLKSLMDFIGVGLAQLDGILNIDNFLGLILWGKTLLTIYLVVFLCQLYLPQMMPFLYKLYLQKQ